MALTEKSNFEFGNVFLTQLNEPSENEIEEKHFPIVTEKRNDILVKSKNTLQSTLLLKKQVEVDRIDIELQAKRNEFNRRMEACRERRKVIEEKKLQMRERTEQFEGFIQENEAKKKRAIQKYTSEAKIKKDKRNEMDMLLEQKKKLTESQRYLANKVKNYKIYEEFLNKVIEILPPNYIEVNDTVLTSLMSRYDTLASTNDHLLQTLKAKNEQIEIEKLNLKEAEQEREKFKLTINSLLSQKQNLLEEAKVRNHERDHQMDNDKKDHLMNLKNNGRIKLAIDNLTNHCKQCDSISFDGLNLEEKLDIVQNFMKEKDVIYKMVMTQKASSHKKKITVNNPPIELLKRKTFVSFTDKTQTIS